MTHSPSTSGDLDRDRSRPVLVGFDGSRQARNAVRWAAREAVECGRSLHVVTVHADDLVDGWDVATGRIGERWSEQQRDVAAGLADAVVQGRVPVHVETREGDPADVLVVAASGAVLLVLGSRGHVGAVGALLGSVSREVLRRVSVPLVLLGPDADPAAETRVVVPTHHGGAEGAAVRWAVARAVERGSEILLLDSWGAEGLSPVLGWEQALETAEREARRQHADALAEVRAVVGTAASVSGRLVRGRGVDVEYAGTAAGDLLVVERGDRDHVPSFRYERCPVVVVPENLLDVPRS
jgi:nucleotide-binding universal stress UspA family protein